MTGITDLENDFVFEKEAADVHLKTLSSKKRAVSKQAFSDKKAFVNRGLRRKIPKEIRGVERQTLKAKYAMHRRGQLGMQARPKFHNKKKQDSQGSKVNVRMLYSRYRRTSRLPACSVEAIENGDQSGVSKAQVRELIEAMLVRSGVETNPGPVFEPELRLYGGEDMISPGVHLNFWALDIEVPDHMDGILLLIEMLLFQAGVEFNPGPRMLENYNTKFLVWMLLLMAGIESNPGPPSVQAQEVAEDREFDEKDKEDLLTQVHDHGEEVVTIPANMSSCSRRCLNCGEIGHMFSQCPRPQKQHVKRCFNCGEEGHTYLTCPKPKNKEKIQKNLNRFKPDHQGLVDRQLAYEHQRDEGYAIADAEKREEDRESADDRRRVVEIHKYDHPVKISQKRLLLKYIHPKDLKNFTVRFGDARYRSMWSSAYAVTVRGTFAAMDEEDKPSNLNCIIHNAIHAIGLVGMTGLTMATIVPAGSGIIAKVVAKVCTTMGGIGLGFVTKFFNDRVRMGDGRIRSYRLVGFVRPSPEECLGGLAPWVELQNPVEPGLVNVQVTDHIYATDSFCGVVFPRHSVVTKVVTVSTTLFWCLMQKSLRLRDKTRKEMVDALSLIAEGLHDVPVPIAYENGRRTIAAETVDMVSDWLVSSPSWNLGGESSALTY
jgi:predicted  nucleic acid-binding Zn-ribbon protein